MYSDEYGAELEHIIYRLTDNNNINKKEVKSLIEKHIKSYIENFYCYFSEIEKLKNLMEHKMNYLEHLQDVFVLYLSGAAEFKNGGIKCDAFDDERNFYFIVYFPTDSINYAIIERYHKYNDKLFSKVYTKDGLLHREDGFAVEYANGKKFNWINGKLIK